MITTLIKLSNYFEDSRFSFAAHDIGDWLLSIQSNLGFWHGGLHSNIQQIETSPSIFNTGQIIKAMMALYRHTEDNKYLYAANNAANWLVSEMRSDGLWPSGDYRASETPSYSTHVAWPILEVWKETQNFEQKKAAETFLNTILERKLKNGVISEISISNLDSIFCPTYPNLGIRVV